MEQSIALMITRKVVVSIKSLPQMVERNGSVIPMDHQLVTLELLASLLSFGSLWYFAITLIIWDISLLQLLVLIMRWRRNRGFVMEIRLCGVIRTQRNGGVTVVRMDPFSIGMSIGTLIAMELIQHY